MDEDSPGRVGRNSAEIGELGILVFKGVIEDEEVTMEIGKSPRK